jgi:hypothetical protein
MAESASHHSAQWKPPWEQSQVPEPLNSDLPDDVQIVAGTTDSNAAVLATDPGDDDGITVLGTTLVMKRFTTFPIRGPGITSHRVGGRWLCGGASNAGAGVLRQFFNDELLTELSRQINPDTNSGLIFRPLPRPGERFPVDDPFLIPILEPRPVSDALFLQGLLEGLADIEAQGWHTLTALGAKPPKRRDQHRWWRSKSAVATDQGTSLRRASDHISAAASSGSCQARSSFAQRIQTID